MKRKYKNPTSENANRIPDNNYHWYLYAITVLKVCMSRIKKKNYLNVSLTSFYGMGDNQI